MINGVFKKSDMKDGMIFTFNEGEVRYLVKGKLFTENNGDLSPTMMQLEHCDNDVRFIGDDKWSSIWENLEKVEYMGEIIWKKRELYTH